MNGSKKQNMESEAADRRVAVLQGAMLAVNFAMVSFICVFIYMTTERIRARYDAREFLDSVVTIPADPRMNLIICLSLMGMLVVTFAIRHFWTSLSNSWTVVTLLVDFIVCAAVIYQLDFNGGGRDEGAYLQMFADYGWEYVQKFNGWYYFRKAKGTGELGEEIFSDSTSRLAMIRRVYRRLALCFGMLAILPIIWLWQIRGTEAAAVVGCWYLVLVLAGLLWLLSIFHKLRGLERAADYPLPDGR